MAKIRKEKQNKGSAPALGGTDKELRSGTWIVALLGTRPVWDLFAKYRVIEKDGRDLKLL